jgi:hypothetical protein
LKKSVSNLRLISPAIRRPDIFGLVRWFIGVIAVVLEVRAAFVEIDRHDRRRVHFGGIALPFENIGRRAIVLAKVERE